MIITLGFYKRKPGLTLDQFHAHWRDVHGPLIAGIPDVGKYIKRYVQHRMVPSEGWPGVGPLDYDGFSEVWFPSLDARKELHALDYFQTEMLADERAFLDMDATRILMFDNQTVQIGKDYADDWMAGRI